MQQFNRLEDVPKNFTGKCMTKDDGTICYYQNGKPHRLDGPAEFFPSGTKVWWKEGKEHRLDGPAVEGADGYANWYVEGLLHRLDGPAVEDPDGKNRWCVKDKEYTKEEFDKLPEVIMYKAGLGVFI
jgi:hypothetical protein